MHEAGRAARSTLHRPAGPFPFLPRMTCMLEVSCYLHSGDIVIITTLLGKRYRHLVEYVCQTLHALHRPCSKHLTPRESDNTSIPSYSVRGGIFKYTTLLLSLRSPVLVGSTFCFDMCLCLHGFCRSLHESAHLPGTFFVAMPLLRKALGWLPDGILLLENILSLKCICPSLPSL